MEVIVISDEDNQEDECNDYSDSEELEMLNSLELRSAYEFIPREYLLNNRLLRYNLTTESVTILSENENRQTNANMFKTFEELCQEYPSPPDNIINQAQESD